jgi:hypothetical protein
MDPRRNGKFDDDTYDLFDLLIKADAEEPDDDTVILHRTGNAIYALSLLNNFFNRPWFRILREISLPKTATVIYGNRSLTMDRAVEVVDAL